MTMFQNTSTRLASPSPQHPRDIDWCAVRRDCTQYQSEACYARLPPCCPILCRLGNAHPSGIRNAATCFAGVPPVPPPRNYAYTAW